VIFGLDPEDRLGRDLHVALGPPRELERRNRLQQRVQGAAERPRLLAGQDRDRRRVGQSPHRCAGRRRRASLFLLG
jgi:hypothetical protein